MKRKYGLTAVVRGAAARALPLTIGLGVCIAVSVLLALLRVACGRLRSASAIICQWWAVTARVRARS